VLILQGAGCIIVSLSCKLALLWKVSTQHVVNISSFEPKSVLKVGPVRTSFISEAAHVPIAPAVPAVRPSKCHRRDHDEQKAVVVVKHHYQGCQLN